MKKRNVLFVLAAMILLTIPLMAQTGIVVQVPGLEVGWIEAAVGLFGFGLVAAINYIKKLLGLEAKKAVLLTVVVSIIAAVGVLLIKGAFTWQFLILYSLAILGELTGWYKFTRKTA